MSHEHIFVEQMTNAIIFTVLASIIVLISAFQRTNPVVLYDDIASYTQKHDEEIGIFSSMFCFFGLFSYPIVSKLSIKFNPLLILCIFLSIGSIGSFILVNSKSFVLACVSRSLIGFGYASSLFALCMISKKSFSEKVSFCIQTILFAFYNIGVFLTFCALPVIVTKCDWIYSYYFSAGLTLLSVLSIILIQVFETFRSNNNSGYNDVGASLFEDNANNKMNFDFSQKQNQLSFKEIISSFQFWQFSLIFAFSCCGYMNLVCMWGGPYLDIYFKFSQIESSGALMLIVLGSMIGSILFSYIFSILNSHKKKFIFIFLIIFSILIMISFMLVNRLCHYGIIGLLLLLFGAFSTSLLSPLMKLIIEFDLSGFSMSLAFSMMSFVSGINQLVSYFIVKNKNGNIIDYHQFQYLFWICPIVFSIIALILSFSIKIPDTSSTSSSIAKISIPPN
ncbi:hypothetical protein TRFO_12540 [Tritrichomonas foetus]|uniref:Lysosomal dipeptide transporter MFSD1 n=1 Tax=Tritrichomonas foetus TaxID=1144522 RepID=A0A1J4L123_9EUKA|nr:hypothetical protein TRFO_12540 [Tritrichomonas foetus]|eukprot:OHT17217.1 hypothetical protein TRFO_12540 [Tritrichomonas foetus]